MGDPGGEVILQVFFSGYCCCYQWFVYVRTYLFILIYIQGERGKKGKEGKSGSHGRKVMVTRYSAFSIYVYVQMRFAVNSGEIGRQH